MIRKFNYTGRKTIKRSSVKIDLFRNLNGYRCFNIALQLDHLPLPADAHVYVEAYHRSGFRRFDFGTIAHRTVPSDRTLYKFSHSAVPLFRVKVVDKTTAHGRILAAMDKIRPESVDDVPVGSQSLLYVEFDDLGNKVWLLDLEGDWPVLRLNQHVDGIAMIAGSEAKFLALVYPEVYRQILTRILIEDEHTDPDCDDDWQSLWLKHACSLMGSTAPPIGPKSEQVVWIEKAVDLFCADFSMLEKFNQSVQGTQ
ncbi:MAG: hypothetical protein COS92_05625 [Desulfobacterales bacterium CG07_land_8_20_14_0_80_52_14]|nr:MAG: hypothetical protein COX20_12575 [Desulfobacterales bacterium CG23_combo_of_CG06-09_8_20_14_all_52_9]PIU49642.1 MAG: hypothetical protein COS92_05625 [Desulfobacterales bacterium CG07_land_8_20_14_0_80_52_14]